MGSTQSTAEKLSSRLQGLVVWRVVHDKRGAVDEVTLTATDPLGRDGEGCGVEVTLRGQGDGHKSSVRTATSARSSGSDSSFARGADWVYCRLYGCSPLSALNMPERTRQDRVVMWHCSAAAALAPLVPFRVSGARLQDGELTCVLAPLALPCPTVASLCRVRVPTGYVTDEKALRQLLSTMASTAPGTVLTDSRRRSRRLSGEGIENREGIVIAVLGASGGLAVTVTPHRPVPIDPPSQADADAAARRWPVAGVAIPQTGTRRGRPTMYSVAVSPYNGGPQWAVQRRYSSFRYLHQVTEGLGVTVAVPFPGRKLLRRSGNEPACFIEARRRALQSWLQALVASCDQPRANRELAAAVLGFVGGNGGCAVPAQEWIVTVRSVKKGSAGKVGISYGPRGDISGVQPGGAAAGAGLEAGMRLLSVAGAAVCNDAAAQAAFAEAGSTFVVVTAEMPGTPHRSMRSSHSILSKRLSPRHGADADSSARSFGSNRRVSFREGTETFDIPEPVAAQQEDPPVRPGAVVALQGLVHLGDLNGKRAVVVDYLGAREKWHVRLSDTQEEVLVNASNMIVDTEAETEKQASTERASVVTLHLTREDAQSKVGVSYSSAAVVTRVQAGAAADRAGVREGMQILSVGGKRVTSDRDAQQAFLEAGAGFDIVVRWPDEARAPTPLPPKPSPDSTPPSLPVAAPDGAAPDASPPTDRTEPMPAPVVTAESGRLTPEPPTVERSHVATGAAADVPAQL
eukprot:TRINITY_DN5371_c2_g1_i1.p1 TRINITY_DN5371_c2_g1~~TRINITY_DN5371_c2_g1_i1.p1  ORF type:complete len:761 (+),score=189.14 TRINITY_DN5371_c2_g1_i1:57-2285(+)